MSAVGSFSSQNIINPFMEWKIEYSNKEILPEELPIKVKDSGNLLSFSFFFACLALNQETEKEVVISERMNSFVPCSWNWWIGTINSRKSQVSDFPII